MSILIYYKYITYYVIRIQVRIDPTEKRVIEQRLIVRYSRKSNGINGYDSMMIDLKHRQDSEH